MKLQASPPRGLIGTGLLLLVSLFLLAAGNLSGSAEADARQAGAFVLDPGVAAAQS